MKHFKNIKSFNKINEEGRYDKLTGDIVDQIWDAIKKNYDKNYIYHYNIAGFSIKTEFIIDLYIGRTDTKGRVRDIDEFLVDDEDDNTITLKMENTFGFYIDSAIDEDNSNIELQIYLDPKREPQCYNKLNMALQDCMRHEIEHLTQEGPNKLPKKEEPVTLRYRNMVLNNINRYFTLRDEIPAMVSGLYRRAKIEKKPLLDIMDDYLDEYVTDGQINERQKAYIISKWLEYARKANIIY